MHYEFLKLSALLFGVNTLHSLCMMFFRDWLEETAKTAVKYICDMLRYPLHTSQPQEKVMFLAPVLSPLESILVPWLTQISPSLAIGFSGYFKSHVISIFKEITGIDLTGEVNTIMSQINNITPNQMSALQAEGDKMKVEAEKLASEAISKLRAESSRFKWILFGVTSVFLITLITTVVIWAIH